MKCALNPGQRVVLANALKAEHEKIKNETHARFANRDFLVVWAEKQVNDSLGEGENPVSLSRDSLFTMFKYVTIEEGDVKRSITWNDLVVPYDPKTHLKPFPKGEKHPKWKDGKASKKKQKTSDRYEKLAFLEAAVSGMSLGLETALKRIVQLESDRDSVRHQLLAAAVIFDRMTKNIADLEAKVATKLKSAAYLFTVVEDRLSLLEKTVLGTDGSFGVTGVNEPEPLPEAEKQEAPKSETTAVDPTSNDRPPEMTLDEA